MNTQNREKAENKKCCSICGVSGNEAKLIYSHIIPKSLSGNMNRKNNLIITCTDCDNELEFGLKQSEFEDFIYQILKLSSKFEDVVKEPIIGDKFKYRPDILITENNGKDRIVVECKSKLMFLRNQNKNIIEQLMKYKEVIGAVKLVLAIPSKIPFEARDEFIEKGIEIWDIDYIMANYYEQLVAMPDSILKTYFMVIHQSNDAHKHSKSLLEKFKDCKPGKEEWSIYQRLVGEILDVYFSPPLNKPIAEHSDFSKSNRRDFILANYANDGFWKYIRNTYSADYIVVDAKNYANKIKKNEVLQIANYLKKHGAGMFAIIFSRKGGDQSGCLHTLREQWVLHGKMIIILDDYDVESILKSNDSRIIEEVIGSKIQEFRLSM